MKMTASSQKVRLFRLGLEFQSFYDLKAILEA